MDNFLFHPSYLKLILSPVILQIAKETIRDCFSFELLINLVVLT